MESAGAPAILVVCCAEIIRASNDTTSPRARPRLDADCLSIGDDCGGLTGRGWILSMGCDGADGLDSRSTFNQSRGFSPSSPQYRIVTRGAISTPLHLPRLCPRVRATFRRALVEITRRHA